MPSSSPTQVPKRVGGQKPNVLTVPGDGACVSTCVVQSRITQSAICKAVCAQLAARVNGLNSHARGHQLASYALIQTPIFALRICLTARTARLTRLETAAGSCSYQLGRQVIGRPRPHHSKWRGLAAQNLANNLRHHMK